MSIEVQINDLTESLERNTMAVNKLRELLATKPPVEGAPTPSATKTEQTKPVKTKTVKTETKAPAVEPDVEEDFDAPATESKKKLTVDDLRKALVALQKAKGSAEASRGVLKANGVTSLGALKDEQQDVLAKCIAECEKQMPATAA